MQYQHPHTVSTDHFEVIEVDSKTLFCDGGGVALGHPRIYMKIEQDAHTIVCPYCSRTFVCNTPH